MNQIEKRHTWLRAFLGGVRHSVPEQFTGSVRVNFLRGGVTGVNIEESVRPIDLEIAV